MLSILIPVYGYDVTQLVENLHEQGARLKAPFEILVFDDGSNSPINENNRKLNDLENAVFKVLEKNVGLSQNRNLLANAAQYENLLFIDGDSIVEKGFLQNYIDALSVSSSVVYGGRVHPENFPKKRESLRWKYGKNVEDKTVKEREKMPYRSVLFNNTLLKKAVFEEIGFEKSLTKYGHEDSLFAYGLSEKQIPVHHIDNPVIHGDIDSNEVFLRKTKMGSQNLTYLIQNKMVDPQFIKIARVYSFLKKTGLHKILGFSYKVFSKPMQKNLLSKKPSLLVFSIFKLTYFCKQNAER